ncbi:gamma-glutamylcyclotransferase family protein [Paraliobacillus sp. JSM ZJ581]|uniref:gamma-glutamylcyclotransferase family protein n=1 Tax=Paraliobacillus sp. JSM ZJ581 TaxID=3342118 RepID=UPI0035A824EC
MSKLYLAYGSNLNLEQMAHRCPTAIVVGASEIKGYKLVFRGPHGHAVATIEPFKGESVPVLVWQITAEDEVALDRYEGWPYLYRKETMKVRLYNKQVDAMVYIMNEGRPINQPSCYYYSTILEGYKSAGFDIELLRKSRDNEEELVTDDAQDE